jgi:hypothetical protein
MPARLPISDTGIIIGEEENGVDKVLNAAALTYVVGSLQRLYCCNIYLLPAWAVDDDKNQPRTTNWGFPTIRPA